MYEVGDVYTGTINLTDNSTPPVPVNAGTVTYTITLPDASLVGPNTVTPSPTGTYSFNYPITQVGQHSLAWSGTGANAFASQDVFNVAATPSGSLISLDEARKGIGFTSGNTVSNEDLREFIAAATPIMEDLIGPCVARTKTETFDGGNPQISLLYPPLLSITSIIESYGTNYQRTLTAQSIFSPGAADAYGYTADMTTGVITRRAAGVAVNFATGLRNIQVVYVAGRILAGNHLLACRRLVRYLWQTEQQNYVPNQFSPDAMGTTPGGFSVPRMVVELCADSLRTQALA